MNHDVTIQTVLRKILKRKAQIAHLEWQRILNPELMFSYDKQIQGLKEDLKGWEKVWERKMP